MSNLGKNEVVTGECRLSYVHLTEPVQVNGKGDPKYSVKILIPKTDKNTMAQLKAAVEAVKEYGVSEGKKVFSGLSEAKLKTVKLNIKDGDTEYPDNPECEGHWCLNVSSPAEYKPGVVNGALKPILNATEIYSGMYGRVQIQLFPYNTAGNIGIGASLQNVQKTKDGDALGGTRRRAEDVFGVFENEESFEDNGTESDPFA